MWITFRCPVCSHRLAVKEENRGRMANCPNCKNSLEVPLSVVDDLSRKHQLRVSNHPKARTYPREEATQGSNTGPPEAPAAGATRTSKVWRFYKGHKRQVWLGILVGLSGLVAVSAGAIRSYGRFPPRQDVERVLRKRGYNLFSAVPEVGLLRGRRLLEFTYVLDANYPLTHSVSVWCSLDDADHVLGVSATVESYDDIKDYARPGFDYYAIRVADLKQKQCWASVGAIEDLSGIHIAPPVHWLGDHYTRSFLRPGQDGWSWDLKQRGGFTLEIGRSAVSEFEINDGTGVQKVKEYSLLLILRDKTW